MGTGSVASQASKLEKEINTLIKIKIILKNVFFSPKYSTANHKNILQWLKYKSVWKFSGSNL
jgi:hypothetical protein